MISKKIALGGIIAIFAAQLFVAGSMILQNEFTISEGEIYKFRIAPIDPNDPFRGKYITLNFDITMVDLPQGKDWKRGQQIFALLSNDLKGFAKIESVQDTRPSSDLDFISIYVSATMEANGQKKVFIDLPFDRFYLPERKAPAAEEIYRSSTQDPEILTYASVSVKEGQAVVTDVLIGDKSITELIP